MKYNYAFLIQYVCQVVRLCTIIKTNILWAKNLTKKKEPSLLLP